MKLLSEKVVNFYLALVARESGTQGNLRVYAFSTFFYSKLSKDGPTHTSWDRWMRRGNITFFDYDLILIPIHQGNHWTLTVREKNNRFILFYFFCFLDH
jgi:sentrin-specific protease 1